MADDTERLEAFSGLLRPVAIGLAIVLAAAFLGKALVDAIRIRQKEQRITVTGSATRRIRSDFIVWEAKVRSRDVVLTMAYKKLAADVPVVVNAKMGVLQVNPEFSTEVSWEGSNDKTTLDKDVLAIVTASFALN